MKTFDNDDVSVVEDVVQVGFSEYVTASRGQTLLAYGLGSCVGIVVRDADAGVAGMAVAVLPEADAGADSIGAKYADTAATELVEAVVDQGARYQHLEAVVVGGATIVEFDDLGTDVGEANVAAARSQLDNLGVGVAAEDVGGDQGRVVRVDSATGAVSVTRADGTRRDR
ncbi:chemotaxis protein CheD [Halorubellus salinus]|uniref:chemotaxis protein CheD n=1 Tax=Halorubellus salinus TaxID=755309 RepID=UPI001D086D27|nr:chemotaxis protein CheD [Halorubellus salinus]